MGKRGPAGLHSGQPAHSLPTNNKTQQLAGLERIAASRFQPGYFFQIPDFPGPWGFKNRRFLRTHAENSWGQWGQMAKTLVSRCHH